MTDYYAQVILILRENGMTQLGNVGKEFLAHMVLARIKDPRISYEEICKDVEKKGISKQMNLKWQKRDIICNHEQMSDMECSVLYLIEGLEVHNEQEVGRRVIEAYIDKIYEEFQKNLKYEEILEKVKNWGLIPDNDGVRLMVTMAYKYRINPQISENNLYDYLMEKCKPFAVINVIKQAKKIPIEIVGGSNLHQVNLRNTQHIVKEEIDKLILESASFCQNLSCTSVRQIMNRILE